MVDEIAKLIEELRERVIVGGGYADVSRDELERLVAAIGPGFNKQLWQKQYMKEYRQGKRRKAS